MKRYKAASEGYAINSQVKKILHEEGYVALRIIPEDSEKINVCEAKKINKGALLPHGADTVLTTQKLSDYGSLILIDQDFPSLINIEE